jgi:Fe-Mn family superoxide dismutase
MRKLPVFAAALAIGGTVMLRNAVAQNVTTQIDISGMSPGLAPDDFTFWRTGDGDVGVWRVLEDSSASDQQVIAQMSTDPTDYRFPLAVYRPISAKNVDVVPRSKPVGGTVDQAGGIVVRLTTPDDYYVVRANALEDNVRFYRMVKGQREQLDGANIKLFPTNGTRWGCEPKMTGSLSPSMEANCSQLWTAPLPALESRAVDQGRQRDVFRRDRDHTVGVVPQGGTMTYAIKPLACDPTRIKGMSEKLIVSHYENNYGGAVNRLNAITAQLAELDFAKAPGFVINGLKREELIASNSMILHELFFASLGDESMPEGDLRDALARDFGSVDRWRNEFSAMGKAQGGGSGWVLLTWSPRDSKLVNQWAMDHTTTLAGGLPILALDMYEHSYHMDYGARAAAYVDAFMAVINWPHVARAYRELRS